jgi:hypothetical protein
MGEPLPDSFTAYLRGLNADDIEFRVLDDGRHVLDITKDVTLYVKPGQDGTAAVIAGLRQLAGAAGAMAWALEAASRKGGDR